MNKTRLEYHNMLSSKAEVQMARSSYHYFEKGEQTRKSVS